MNFSKHKRQAGVYLLQLVEHLLLVPPLARRLTPSKIQIQCFNVAPCIPNEFKACGWSISFLIQIQRLLKLLPCLNSTLSMALRNALL